MNPHWQVAPSPDEIAKLDRARIAEDPVFAEAGGEDEAELAKSLLEQHGAEKCAAALAKLLRARWPAAEDIRDPGFCAAAPRQGAQARPRARRPRRVRLGAARGRAQQARGGQMDPAHALPQGRPRSRGHWRDPHFSGRNQGGDRERQGGSLPQGHAPARTGQGSRGPVQRPQRPGASGAPKTPLRQKAGQETSPAQHDKPGDHRQASPDPAIPETARPDAHREGPHQAASSMA